MVRLVEADPVMVPPPPVADVLADSDPCESDSVTVKLSLVVLPLSDRLTPAIVVATPSPTVAVVGAAMTGSPLTVTAMVAAAA